MTPDERQMLTGLFERIKAAANGPRDAQAEAFIADNVRAVPVAPYLLAQTVLVQEQALGAAAQRLQELEDKIHALEQQQQGSGSFLGGIGKSMFGTNPPPSPTAAPQRPQAAPAAPSGPWGNQAPAGPWGQPPQAPPAGPWAQPVAGGGGGFLSGALTTAAGVAGGMLLADSMRNLFTGGHNATLANMAGPGFLGGSSNPAGETIINNYYGSDSAQRAQDLQQDQDQDQDDAQDAADDYTSGNDFDTGGGFGGDFGGGDSFDV
jgi:hypothetical protein